ncbi:SDR family NAD(P)-dependent oxidoreductase [Nocardia alni]|uniref:SDR family NAD(P)-dependent oxidoreductase n=1 Tax=Nocardia alni TaxID=2815723 RepID=UPI001C24705A|nr:SDR family oxidoreductase [Nocardia alni]
MVNELTGKVAIVTGGAAGIGEAIVERFAAEDARVVVADRDAERGKALADGYGPGVVFVETDVADPGQMTALVTAAVDLFGGLHIMVNNAGVSGAMHPGFLEDDLADFHQVLGVNLLGVMVGTREAARHMVSGGGGSIVNVSSIGGIQAGAGVMTYRASKAAVIHFTKSAAMEFADRDIRINCIAPGNIPTSLLEKAVASMSPEESERFIAATRDIMRDTKPLRRDGQSRDVAEAALYFGSDRSAYVTGTVLPVDGGTTAGMKSRIGKE